jgi:hypothetical protein
VFLILLVQRVYATEQIGVPIPSDVSTYTQNSPVTVTDTSGGPTYGIYVLGNSTDPALSLTVNATVNSSATNSAGASYAYGVYSYNETDPSNSRPLSNLVVTGNGNISAVAEANGDYVAAEAYGVYVYEIRRDFINNGSISATAQASGGLSLASALGVYVEDTIEGSFINNGRISAKATVGDAVGERSYVSAWGSGVYIDGAVDSFVNKGTISVSVSAGDAVGSKSYVKIDEDGYPSAYGVFFGDVVNNFLNKGQISVEASAGNALGTNSTVYVGSVYGVSFEEGVNSFTNEGTIYVGASAGNALGTNSTVGIEGIFGVYADNVVSGSFVNKGLIHTSVKGGSGSKISNVAGLVLEGASNTTVSNEGTIYVNVDTSNAKSVQDIAGIVISDSLNVTISNPGTIAVSVIAPSSAINNIRTLYIKNSQVTLKDKFALMFGAPGTGPTTAPIYVDANSILDLNNATMVVRVWNDSASSIIMNTPYAIIESDGTVHGNWGGLERGYANTLIDVRWYDPAVTNKDAMVIFRYNALNNPAQAMAPVRSIIGAVGVNSFISGIVSTVVPVSSPLVLVKEEKPVMLAASAVSDMPVGYGLGGATYRGGMWFIPVYTKVKASDLGFDADAYGFNLRFGGFLTRDLSLGLYATYARTDVDYSITGAKSGNIDLFAVGVTGRWTFMKDAYLRFNVNGFKTNNDYEGRTGLNYEMKEKARYDVKGMEGEVMIGKVYRGRIALIPEIGLKYNYYNPDSFWTKAYDSTGRVPAWDRYYSPSAQHVWKVAAGVNVVGDTKWGGNPVRLYLMGRVEQALGKNEVEVINYMRSDPTRYKLTKRLSKTTFVGQVGADVSLTKNFGIELSGRGDFNADYSAYTGKAVIWYRW